MTSPVSETPPLPILRIESPDDPRVAEFRDIPDPVLLRQRGAFVAEGRLVVQRLLDASQFHPRALLVTDAALAALEDQLGGTRARDLPIYVTTPNVMRSIGGFDFHRGCLAIGDRPASARVDDLLREGVPQRPLFVLEHIGNADNVGGIFRNAAAFGAAAVVLSPRCCDPLYRKAIRTSMGACLQIPFTRLDDWPDGLKLVRDRGYYLIALTPDRTATPLEHFSVPGGVRGVALLLGSEGAGLSPEVVVAADVAVRISVERTVDSLNVATAAAVALHHFRSA